MRILLTTTSYQDTPGAHHQLLKDSGFEIVTARGPLTASQLQEIIKNNAPFDGLLCGDDEITADIIDRFGESLKVISKYGIGLDKIDVPYATQKRLAVLFTPGVNHTTVAEHTFGLMIALAKDFHTHISKVKSGQWYRATGRELCGLTLGVLGMGRIGKEVIKRAKAFGMNVIAYDTWWDKDFASAHGVKQCHFADNVLSGADVISLHMNLSHDNTHYINAQRIALMKDDAMLINTARGGIVDEAAIVHAIQRGKLSGYGTDVLEEEPMRENHPFNDEANIIVTPHIASRTKQSVQRQASRATLNLIHYLKGESDYIQANPFDGQD